MPEHGSNQPDAEQPSEPELERFFEQKDDNDVRQVVRDLPHNQTEIVPAPREFLEQLGQQYIDNLETVPVNPEAPWDGAGEQVLHRWMAEAKTSSADHQKAGYKLKKRYKILQFALIISATIVFVESALIPCNTDQFALVAIRVVFTAINLLIAQLNQALNYGSKYQQHFEYEGKFAQYALDIEEILATDIDFRAPKDKTITSLLERKKQLVNAPEL